MLKRLAVFFNILDGGAQCAVRSDGIADDLDAVDDGGVVAAVEFLAYLFHGHAGDVADDVHGHLPIGYPRSRRQRCG